MDALPFEFARPGLPLVVIERQAEAQGQSGVTLLDTGAVGPFPLFLGEAFARKLGLSLGPPVTPDAQTALGSGRVGYRTARLARFSLGPVELRDVEVAVTPVVDELAGALGRPVDIIIGERFLEGRTVRIDYGDRRLDLEAATGPEATAMSFTLAPQRPLTLVQVRLNGRGPFVLEIDTGASRTSLSPGAADRAGVRPFGSASIQGAAGAVQGRFGRLDLQIGELRRKDQAVMIMDVFETLGAAAGAKVDGILGADVLEGSRLTLDYRTRRLWIEPGAGRR